MTALLLIDIQAGLDQLDYYGGARNNLDAKFNCRKILDFFRDKNFPIFHIQHCSTNPASPLHPTKTGNAIKSIVQPLDSEPLFQKNVNSAFICTELKKRLEAEKIRELIIIGLTTDHCVSSTARMSENLGFKTIVVSDATAAFDTIGIDGTKYEVELIHLTALASLKDEFATIVDTQALIENLSE
jgi:nicotinamidase-related amidase